MLLATVMTLFSSLPMAFLSKETSQLVYLLAAAQGISLMIVLNTATGLISELIGKDTSNSAFVYGIYSFLDKLANGIILFVMVRDYSRDQTALRWIMAITPVFCAGFAVLLNNRAVSISIPNNSSITLY